MAVPIPAKGMRMVAPNIGPAMSSFFVTPEIDLIPILNPSPGRHVWHIKNKLRMHLAPGQRKIYGSVENAFIAEENSFRISPSG
ncbi:hypothetical protein [Mycolicibacterium lutetiense]|uniref:Uncharacterized protein n=1 Tax=Mycolicibacterium lutetiense TaxID=1641992 RepID=A0ABS4ZYD0_9MYCO|nr:hypothetical protein [Mycolicibacterium lutetiense]MBP2454506.1 hypothetical protein [Mycolicibacterium lutetiense]